MTDSGTVISWFRWPARITTRAVMTFTMLPMGRSVSRAVLHRIWPVAALASAAPWAAIPDGPGTGGGRLALPNRYGCGLAAEGGPTTAPASARPSTNVNSTPTGPRGVLTGPL